MGHVCPSSSSSFSSSSPAPGTSPTAAAGRPRRLHRSGARWSCQLACTRWHRLLKLPLPGAAYSCVGGVTEARVASPVSGSPARPSPTSAGAEDCAWVSQSVRHQSQLRQAPCHLFQAPSGWRGIQGFFWVERNSLWLLARKQRDAVFMVTFAPLWHKILSHRP